MATARVQEYLSTIPLVTKSLLVVNISIHVVLFVTSYPLFNLAISPILIIARGEYYRLVSSAFVHAGLLHIFMNMSTLLAIGRSLELQYGSLVLMFLTAWSLILTGVTFVGLVWLYSIATFEPGVLATSAVGYSGVLFAYALIEAFHSPDTSRSVFGLVSVPTKAYPFILLVLIQVLMPNISWWGHLSGLLVGLILVSRPGVDIFMPSTECLRYLEQTCFCRTLQSAGGFVPVQDKTLVLAGLDCAACGWAASWVLGAVTAVALFLWQLLTAILQTVGVPPGWVQRVEGVAAHTADSAKQCVSACVGAMLGLCRGWGEGSTASDVPAVAAGGAGPGLLRTGAYRLSGYSPLSQQEPQDLGGAAFPTGGGASGGGGPDIELGERKGTGPKAPASSGVHFV